MRDKNDEIINQFLQLLEDDIIDHPQRLTPLDTDLLRPAKLLTKGMVIDIDESLPMDDAYSITMDNLGR